MEKIDFTTRKVSSSALKEAKKSTRDFLWYYNKPKTSGKHFDFGQAAELYLIDKKEFYDKVTVLDESKRPFPDKNYQTKANKEWKDKFYEDNAGKYIINLTGADSLEQLVKIENLVKSHPMSDLLFSDDAEYQTEFEWVCPISGLNRYCRTDLVVPSKGVIIDIKTYADDSFERAATKHDHFLQARDQILGARENGLEVEAYYWCAISKSEPYHVDFYEYPIEEDLRVEEIHNSIMYRLRDDLKLDNVYSIPFHRSPVERLKIPNYYK